MVEAVLRRRVLGGKKPQVQYLLKWVNERTATWETRHSYERWKGGVDYESDGALSRDKIDARFDELDALAIASQQAPKKKRKR